MRTAAAGIGRVAGLARAGLLNLVLVNLARLVPRSPRQWLFGHQGGLFAGNSKYLFLWVATNRPDLRAVWLADNDATVRLITDAGFVAYRRWSLRGVRATVRSRVLVYCHGLSDVNARLSGGAYLANLWHGVGLKSTMFGDRTGIMSHYKRRWSNPLGRTLFYAYLKAPDMLATTSDFMQAHFAEQFELPRERCPQLGYPRLDTVADGELRRLAIDLDARQGFRFNPAGRREAYLYMPTWRDTGRPFLTAALPDLDRLNDLLRARDALLYIKLHPWTKESLPAGYSHIASWPDEIETYSYFDQLTGLITDYSSVLYDYLFSRDGGAILYTFDRASYEAEDHALLYPFDENVAGVTVQDFDALCDVLARGTALVPCARAAAIREKFWGGSAVPASPAIVSYIEKAVARRGIRRASGTPAASR